MATDSINLKITVDANQAEQATVNYRGKIKELRDQMSALSEATDGLANATEEQKRAYIDAAVEAARMTDSLGDINTQIQVLSDDYLYFNTTLDALKGGTAVVQGLVGTMDLLGLSNTGVEQVVKTLMSLQGVMNSINAVQQLFNKDSRVRIVLEKLLSTTNTKVAATTAVETGATKAATVAQRGLNAAMKANPIILIVSALISLIAVTGTFIKKSIEAKKASEDEAKANEDLKKSIEDLEQARRQAAADTSNNTQQTKDNINNLYELAKAAKEGSEEQASYFKQLADATGLQVTNLEEASKAVQNYNEVQVYAKLAIQNAKDEIALQNGLLKTAKEAYDNGTISLYQYNIRVENCNNAISRQNKIIAENTATLDANKKSAGAATNATKKHTSSVNSQIKKLSELKESLMKVNKDIAVYNEDWENAAKAETSIVTAEWEKQKQEYEKLIKQTKNKERIAVLNELIAKGEENLQNDIAEINKKYGKKIWEEKINNLDSESATYWDDYIKLLTEGLEKGFATEKQLSDANKEKRQTEDEAAAKKLANQYEIEAKEQEVARIKGRVAGMQEGTPEYFDALIEQAEAQRELELEQLEQDKEAKLLSEEDYQIRKKEIIDRYRTENLQAQRDDAQKEIEIKELTYQAIGEIASGLHSTLGSLQEAELADETKSEKEKLQIQKKYAIASLLINIAESGVALATSIPKTLEAYADIPVAGPIIAAIQIAATTAAIIAQIAKIRQYQQQINKAARGAYVVGPSHTAGGVDYELEGGEIVLNKNVAKVPQFRAIASAMNVATGGVALGGGGVASQQSFGVTKEDVQSIVAETVAGIAAIPVVVSAQTITETQRRVNVTQTRSQI